MRNRDGFTLMELMMVTIIIGVLATVAMAGFTRVREQSMTAATRSELRNLITAAEMYRAVNGVLPERLADLVDGGFHRGSSNIGYCRFERTAGPPEGILVEAAHVGSHVHLVARYPSAGVSLEMSHAATDCS